MRKLGTHLTNIAFVALLALQVSGTHIHVAVGDQGDADTHGIHVEHGLSLEHELSGHDDHVDLAVTDTPLSHSQIDHIAHNTQSWVAPAPASVQARRSVPQSNVPVCRDSRIRPPLRAPPAYV